MATPAWTLGLAVIASFFSAGATFLIKQASTKISISMKGLFGNGKLISGLFLYGISTLLALAAFRYGELSVLYPFFALQYVWANLLSKKFLGETINALKWTGIALIFAGVVLTGIGA